MSIAQSGLALEQAPPITVPFRFFLTAPLFLLAAAGLMAWYGADALTMRQSPVTLALAHLLAVGVVSMVMCGALMQMLPVVAGSPVARPRLVAAISHGMLTLGTPLLAAAFLTGDKILSHAAMGLLVLGFGTFILSAGLSLVRVRVYNATVVSMSCAVISLTITLCMGVELLLARVGEYAVDYSLLAGLHPAWGLVGWVALLIIGVAYQVVPMFQITPNYPRFLTRTLTGVMFGLLLAKSIAAWWHAPNPVDVAINAGLVAALVLFAILTLNLQSRRKRRQTDPTLLYWRCGMSALAVAALGSVPLQLLPSGAGEALRLLLGVIFIAGFVISVMTGMLYKIVPFLAWFHLQSRYVRMMVIPNMKELIPDACARRQMLAWFTACALLVLATLSPRIFTYPAAFMIALAAVWLEWNLLKVVISYRHIQSIAMAEPQPTIPS